MGVRLRFFRHSFLQGHKDVLTMGRKVIDFFFNLPRNGLPDGRGDEIFALSPFSART